jgi:hypothetical protein
VTKHKTDYRNNRKCQNNVAVFYVCSLEDAVCSEIQDEDNLQDGVCHNEREHNNTLRRYTKKIVQK